MASALGLLRSGDEAELFSFCERHVDSSLFFFHNVERAGLDDRGQTFQGTYAVHRENGAITAVAAHYWNGNIALQGDAGLEAAAAHAVAASGRAIQGLIGPLSLVKRVRASLGLLEREVAHGGDEILFALELERIRVPEPLRSGQVECRHPHEGELELLVEWRIAYCLEMLGAVRGPELERQCRQQMENLIGSRECWVLVDHGRLSAFTAFNAAARGIVQVGGVYTPPELRSRGYARAAVAGSLLEARANDATRSVLFTGEDNHGAQRAYRSLGYEPIGDWALVLFR
jgi:predicted GNAT family acetyltransferase